MIHGDSEQIESDARESDGHFNNPLEDSDDEGGGARLDGEDDDDGNGGNDGDDDHSGSTAYMSLDPGSEHPVTPST